MWGTTVKAISPSGQLNTTTNQQIARINYKRPETWSFFLAAKIVGGTVSGGGILTVRMDLLFGVGRSVFDTRQSEGQGIPRIAFAVFAWDLAGITDPVQDTPFATKYTNRVLSPPLIDEDLTTQQPLDWIPAQDIQVQSSFRHNKTDIADTVTLELSSYFAPRVHTRPDWLAEDPAKQFVGGETGGT